MNPFEQENQRRADYKAYLDGLKPGDVVRSVGKDHWRGPFVSTLTVVKRTPKQIVFTNGNGHEVRYRADDGRIVGSDRYGTLPLQSSQDELNDTLAEIKRAKLAQDLAGKKFGKLPLAAIEEVLAVLAKYETGEKA